MEKNKPLMSKIKYLSLIFSIILVAACSHNNLQQQEYKRARLAYEQEDYAKSVEKLLPLAKNGDMKAQYALGYLMYYGLGVKQDIAAGKIWIRTSAEQGYKPARFALQKINKNEP